MNIKEIYVFVKILSQCARKEGRKFKSLEVREASSSHLKIWQIATSSIILHIIQRLCSALAEAYCYDSVDVHIFLGKNFLQNGKIV